MRARWGLCVGKAKIIVCPYQTDCHGCPHQTDSHPSTRNLDSTPGMQHRHAAYKDHLDTRQDGSARQGWSPDRVQRRGEGPVKGVDDGFMRLATTKGTHPCHPPLPTQPHLCNQHCHRSNSVPTSFATIPVQRKWLGSTTTAAARGGRGLHGSMAFPKHLSFGRTTKMDLGSFDFIRVLGPPP